MATTTRSRRKPAADKSAVTPAEAPIQAPAEARAEPVAAAPAPPPARRQAAARKAPAKKTAPTQAEGVPSPAAAAPASAKPGAVKAPAARPPARKAAARKTPAPAAPVPAEPLPEAPAPAAAVVAEPAPGAAPGAPPAKRAKPAKPTQPAAAAKRAPARKRPAGRAAAPAPAVDPVVAATVEAVAAVLAAAPAGTAETRPAAPAPAPRPPAEPAPPPGPAHSALRVVEQDQRRHLVWKPGSACPTALRKAVQARLDGQGRLAADDDEALPTLLRLAAEHDHPLEVDAEVWLQFAANRDARHRLAVLEAAYPEGSGSPALQTLLHTTLPAFQAEGALFSVVAGRALIADERGLGKRAQAIAAATLWQRHFGLQRVLVLCTPAQRSAWQHAWCRWARPAQAPQLIEGGLHQRQALWSAEAEVRILSPEALDSDAAHLARWAPELVIVDEPQQLAGWSMLQAPHALVLCGAPLIEPPTLLHAIVDWLDPLRQGALWALQRIQAAREQGLSLPDEELDQLDEGLSRVMLQRLRSEVQDQLPPQVHSERLVPLAPPQREAHDRLQAQVQRLLAGWRRSGYLSNTDQWQLAQLLQALPTACHRSDPADANSPLAEASVAQLQAQLQDWRATGTERIGLVCPRPADREQLMQRLDIPPGLRWLGAGDTPGPELDVVLQVGVPWQAPAAAATVPAGQQWVHLAAQDSLELGLLDTLAARHDLPAGPGGAEGFLHGPRLAAWLNAWCLACPEAAALA